LFFCSSYNIVKIAFKSIIYKTDFIKSVRNDINNVNEESTSNSIVIEESPRENKGSNDKTKKKNTKKEKSI